MRIIGLTGHPSSGKDTVAHYLETKGFKHISSGDILREEMRKQGIPIDRPHMHDFSNKMRALRGPGYLAEEAIRYISGNTIISGLRNISETDILKKEFGPAYALVAIDAPVETRYSWAQGRGRDGDGISFEQFKAQEELERHGNSDSQQVDDMIAKADHLVQNIGTKLELLQKIDELLFVI